MSTLRIDNFGPSAGGTTYSARGIAKAWVNFNGTGTIAARDSENVSSLTDHGTGDYSTNFTNAFANTNYATACMTNGGGAGAVMAPYSTATLDVSSQRMGTRRTDTFNAQDSEYVNYAYYGDLA